MIPDFYSHALFQKILPFPSATVAQIIAQKTFVEDNEDFSMETKLYLGEIDCPVTKLFGTLGGDIADKVAEGGNGDDTWLKTERLNLGWKKKKIGGGWEKAKIVSQRSREICDLWTTDILTTTDLAGAKDESIFEAELGQLSATVGKGSTQLDIFAVVRDSDFTFSDDAQASRIMSDLKFVPGVAYPVTYNTDFNMKTDESFSRVFFHGIGAPLMATSDEVTDPEHLKYGPFMVDMDFMSELKYRSDRFKKYGARVHFDENQMVTAIYDSGEEKLFLPGEPGWEEAKLQARVSALTLCTVREHLAQTHLQVSNNASYESVINLHPEHPIRRLVAMHTYNAVGINQLAFEVLVPDQCAIFRATPLEYEGGFRDVFNNAYSTSVAFQPFTDREIKNPKLKELAYPEGDDENSKFPYLSEGREFYEITRTFVSEWLEKAGDEAKDEYAIDFYEAMRKKTEGMAYELPIYSHDNMVDLITTIIWTVTCYHELIGHVTDYSIVPSRAGLRIAKSDKTQVDAQAFLVGAFVTAATALPSPQLMAEFPNYIGAGGAPEWERDVWTKYLAQMGLQTKKVQDRDRNSDFEFKYFDPSLFECSVSV